MKYLILYPDEYELSALTIQARLLERGLKELSHDVICLCSGFKFSKEIEYSSFRPDVIVGVGFWGNMPELILEPMKRGIKAVPWFNADGWVANYHEVLNSLPLIIVTSDWVKNAYARDGVNPKNIRSVHVGIDPNLFKPLPEDDAKTKNIRRMFGVKDDEIMILTAGGDVTSKGAQEMFRAIAAVKKNLPPFKYVCKAWFSANTAEWRKKESELINELGISDKVIFHDEVIHHSYMPYLLNACDIYAAPSRLEGFGMIQVEAMACGKPVISINSMGPADTIVHGKTGFLAEVEQEIKLNKEWVYPNMGFDKKMQIEFPTPKTFAYRASVDQLADFTLKLCSDKNLRKKMGKAAAQHALENFHYRSIAKKVADLIEEHLCTKNSSCSIEPADKPASTQLPD